MTMMKTRPIMLDSINANLKSFAKKVLIMVPMMAYCLHDEMPVHDFLAIKEMPFEDESKRLVGILI
jgi:hypothetical protein